MRFLNCIGTKKSSKHYNSDSDEDEQDQDQDQDLDVEVDQNNIKNGKEDGGESELSELEDDEDG